MAREKEVYDIKKFDGTNFALWKEQIQDVLVQKNQLDAILSAQRTEEMGLTDIQWTRLNAVARSTIRLHLADSVYFTVLECGTSHQVWTKLCNTYERNTASNKVFLMRSLYNLWMKDSANVSSHLNEFDSLFAQIRAQGLTIDDEMKAIHLLCLLPDSWDTFCIAISNSAPNGKLVYNEVAAALLSEEIRRKTMGGQQRHGKAHYVKKDGKNRGRSRSRDQDGKGRNRSGQSQSLKRTLSAIIVEKLVITRRIVIFGRRRKAKAKRDLRDGGVSKTLAIEDKPKSLVVIKEINMVTEVDQDICFLDSNLPAEILVSGEVSHSWVLDSGASLHVTPHREWFTSYESGSHGTVSLGDSYECNIVGIGDICMILPNGTQFKIEKVCHVPRLTRNLLSVGMLDDIGYKVSFANQSWKISKGNLNIASGSKIGSLYPLYVSCKNDLLSVIELPNVSLWHSRLGHMSRKAMENLSRMGYFPALSFSDFPFCEHCLYGKQTRGSRNVKFDTVRQPLELVHSDVCGPMPSKSLGGAQYFVTFIDDATRRVWAYAIKTKDETFACFKRFLSRAEAQSGKKLKALRTDNGGEYIANDFKQFCAERGIKREFTAPYTPAQNGVAERMNRTIQERVMSMLSQSGLTQGFWGEALYSAIYLINRTAKCVIGSSDSRRVVVRTQGVI